MLRVRNLMRLGVPTLSRLCYKQEPPLVQFDNIALANLPPDGLLLDAGCGSETRVSTHRKCKMAVGVDREKPRSSHVPGLDGVVLGDLSVLPFQSGIFDVVVSWMVVEHLDNPQACFTELSRVCKDNGLVILATPNVCHYAVFVTKLTPYRVHEWFRKAVLKVPGSSYPTTYKANTPGRLVKMMKQAGFQPAEVRLIDTGPAYLAWLTPAYFVGLLYHRLVSRFRWLAFLRLTIVGVFRKASSAGDRHQVVPRTDMKEYWVEGESVVPEENGKFTSEDYTDEHATVYERRYEEGQRNIKVDLVRKQLTDIKGKKVLDVGAGIGYFSNLCHESGADVVATDHAISMLNRIRAKYGNTFSIIRLKSHLLPFGSGVFDVVLALDVIEHLYEVRQTLAEIRRVIKKGGILLVTTDNPDFSLGVIHLSIARKLLNVLPITVRDALRRWYQGGLAKSSPYAPPKSTHVEYYALPRLVALMQDSEFQPVYFDTYPNRSSYGIYGRLVEKILTGRLKRYKWPSAIYVFKATGE